ncbi:MAG: ribosome small subunit-dependent GTPase A [Ruminococcaceae bacterium]|nr:ribosome small subunit-dependent GTPase A [Oscillospiraceae bacterium]
MDGLIIKGIGGAYSVKSEGKIYCCKARGVFRKEGISPLAGDIVSFEVEKDGEGVINEIQKRKNSLIRPPVANIDKLFIITSIKDPIPNRLIIDKTLAAAFVKDIEPILVISKADMAETDELCAIYKKAGIKTYSVSSVNSEGVEAVREELKSGISVFTGNSGVGKSSLLNALFGELNLNTGEISKKLGRGKHTTRHVELYEIGENAYVADTPGFSTMDMQRYELDDKEQIIFGFPDLEKYSLNCKFTSCSHTGEKGCAVSKAVEDGLVSRERHESYITMYNEVKDIKQWQKQKNV